MDWNAFLTQTIENIVATIPALAVLASPLIYGLKKIKEVTSKFPSSVDETKETLTSKFNDTTNNLKSMFEEKNEELQQKVNGSLVGMKDELASYQKQLMETKDQANMLVKQNKAYMDTLAEVVGKDPKLIESGIATKLSTRLNMTNEELLAYPEKLMNDNGLLEKALVEAKTMLGEEKYNALLAKVNGKEV